MLRNEALNRKYGGGFLQPATCGACLCDVRILRIHAVVSRIDGSVVFYTKQVEMVWIRRHQCRHRAEDSSAELLSDGKPATPARFKDPVCAEHPPPTLCHPVRDQQQFRTREPRRRHDVDGKVLACDQEPALGTVTSRL